jgi:hypothetical protein
MANGDGSANEVVLVRDVLMREIETINTYQAIMDRSSTPEVKEFLNHVIDEEKEHVAEALEIIKRLDPVQASLLEANHGHPGNPTPSSSNRLTVGSLRRQ